MHSSLLHTEEGLLLATHSDHSQLRMAPAEGGMAGKTGLVRVEISLKDKIMAYFSKSRRISGFFRDIPLLNMEREWIKVAGSLSEPLTAHNINHFLTFLLVDYPHTITTYNCQEFCHYLNKKLESQGKHIIVYICICIYVYIQRIYVYMYV